MSNNYESPSADISAKYLTPCCKSYKQHRCIAARITAFPQEIRRLEQAQGKFGESRSLIEEMGRLIQAQRMYSYPISLIRRFEDGQERARSRAERELISSLPYILREPLPPFLLDLSQMNQRDTCEGTESHKVK